RMFPDRIFQSWSLPARSGGRSSSGSFSSVPRPLDLGKLDGTHGTSSPSRPDTTMHSRPGTKKWNRLCGAILFSRHAPQCNELWSELPKEFEAFCLGEPKVVRCYMDPSLGARDFRREHDRNASDGQMAR